MLPPCIEDWIAPTHPARFIRAFVDALDLEAVGITWASGEGGRPAYAPGLLLKVWLYGYYERMRSCRKLEQACRGRVQAALAALDAADEKHLHPADADARVMKCRDPNRNAFAYNGQAVADARSGIIVACDVVQDCNDEHQLNAMLDTVAEQAGQTAQRTVGDTGYANGAELAQAEAAQREVVIALPQSVRPNSDKPYAGSNFTYDAERDVYMCPHGRELTLRGVRERKDKGYVLHRYRCAVKDCPHRDQCTKDPKGRTIERNQYADVIQRQYDKQQLPHVKADLAKRGYLIEPVFAFIKQHLGFRRFTLSGLDNVRTQWSLLCTTYNLHKLYQHWQHRKLRLDAPKPTPSPNTFCLIPGGSRIHHALQSAYDALFFQLRSRFRTRSPQQIPCAP